MCFIAIVPLNDKNHLPVDYSEWQEAECIQCCECTARPCGVILVNAKILLSSVQADKDAGIHEMLTWEDKGTKHPQNGPKR